LELHPLQVQKDIARDLRQIGLGTMGLADMFIKMGITYGSKDSIELINTLYQFIIETQIETSLMLAKIDGHYPKCKKE
jgi:ribonucleoside-diphosphate reductase alpha chain